MRTLHFTKTFLKPSETFIARYIEASVTWGKAGVMYQYPDANYKTRSHLGNVQRYPVREEEYKKYTPGGLTRILYQKMTGDRLFYRSVRKRVQEFNPDVIHCHFGVQGLHLSKAFEGKELDIPFVISFYGFDASQKPASDPVYRREIREALNAATAIFVEGEALKQKVVELGAHPERVIINPIMIAFDEYQPKETWYEPGDPITFLMAARFLEKKGFHLFLEAIGEMKSELPLFEIQFIGEGDYIEKYHQVIDKFDLEDHVRFLGWKSHKELLNLIRKADFFVHPSLTASDNDSEGGAPTVLLEAQALRTPVIASNHADIPNVMGYADFLCDEGDVNDLKEKMRDAVQSNDLESLTQKGRERVARYHNIESDLYKQNMEQVKRLYQSRK